MRRPKSPGKPSGPGRKEPRPAHLTPKPTLLDRIEGRIASSPGTWLVVTLICSVLFSLLLFDVKISEGNDDSMYIESGYFFAKDFTGFYTANAPLYPMILSLPIMLFGVNLILLKFFSLLFSLAHLMVFYAAFRKRIPLLVLFPILFLVSINAYYLYFASQTYTEAFYMLLQGILIYCVLLVLDRAREDESLKNTWRQWMAVGFMFLLLSLCKNVALACIPALVLFFLIQRQYKSIAWFVGAVFLFRGFFEVLRNFIWERSDQFASQTSILMQKDPYDPSKGQEDVAGFIDRFFGNIDLYISKRFYQILGFRGPDEVTVNAALSFITIVALALTFITVFRRKHKVLMFTGLYALCMSGLTFLVLQTRWDQPRYFIVYVHFFLLIFFYGLYTRCNRSTFWAPRIYLLTLLIVVGSSLIASVRKGAGNMPTLRENLSGDIYHGFTNDYVNYLKLSRWCADSLPETAYVAARKAPMSFIYSGGKPFYPIYTASTSDADSVLALFKREKVTHVMLANLRRNPKAVDGFIINTVHRMIQPVAVKYPGKIQFVKRIGSTEPADLYRIVY